MTRTIITAAALLTISGAAFAQEQPAGFGNRAPIYEAIPAAGGDSGPAPVVKEFVTGQAKGQLLATDFLGLPVFDVGGTPLGTIDDVLFDEGGKLSVIVLNVGDLLGTDKRIAFNLADLRRAQDSDTAKLVAAIDRTQIEAAPNFTVLAEEMGMNDGQSLTEDEAEGATEIVPPN